MTARSVGYYHNHYEYSYGSGAGIGSGASSNVKQTNGGNIIITGGVVNAKAWYGGAGIGGGAWDNYLLEFKYNGGNGGNINISGGVINAIGTFGGAGIGGGVGGNGAEVTISGGTISAESIRGMKDLVPKGSPYSENTYGEYSGQDIGGGCDASSIVECADASSNGSLTVSGTSALFLRNDKSTPVTTLSHGHKTFSDSTAVTGFTVPTTWDSDFGAWLLPQLYAVTVNSGTGGGDFAEGDTVTITANAPATGKVFDKWTTSDGVVFGDANSVTTTFVMPDKAVSVTATYKDAPVTTYAVTVTNGTGGGDFAEGATVSITAGAPATGKVFDKWTTADGVTFGDASKATTTFVMPAKAVTVTATYKDAPVTTYGVTVNSGTGGGDFAAGSTVNITANAAATGKVFDKWTTADGVTFGDASKATTTFVMPAKAVTVTATYKNNPEPVVPDPTDPEKPVDPDPEKFSYKIIKGANGKWDKTSKAGLEFISNGDFDKFEEVKVDGKTIDKKHYSAKAGSTIVTLKDSLLSTLGKGDHSLTLVFEDGKAETKFTILEKETLPKTGDAVYPTMLFGFILILAGVFMYRRREA